MPGCSPGTLDGVQNLAIGLTSVASGLDSFASPGVRIDQPAVQTLEAFVYTHPRCPARGVVESPCIRNVVALIAGAPSFECDRGSFAVKMLDALEQIQQAHDVRGSAADVEDPSRQT